MPEAQEMTMDVAEAPFLEDMPLDRHIRDEDTDEALEAASIDLLAKALEFAKLNERKRRLTSILEKTKERMNEISEEIADKMIFENPNIKVKVGHDKKGKPKFKTVFVKSQIWAGHNDDKDALLKAMKEAGMEDMVAENFNVQSLSAYVRAYDPDRKLSLEELKEQLPEQIQPHIKLSEVIKVAVKS